MRGQGVLIGGGQCGALAQQVRWSETTLGSPESWPTGLRAAVNLILNSGQPMFVAWGQDLNFIYNDGYALILGQRHPWALGRPFRQIWPEIWHKIWPLIERALEGSASWVEDMHLVMERNGSPEDTWYTFSYSPLFNDEGRVEGMVCSCIETTEQVNSRRLNSFRLSLDKALRGASSSTAAMAAAMAVLGTETGSQRVGYAEASDDERSLRIEQEWTNGSAATGAGPHDLAVLGQHIPAELMRGHTVRVEDVLTDSRLKSEGAELSAMQARAFVAVPLRRFDRLRALLYLHSATPRRWRVNEVAFAEEALERTWDAVERIRAQTLLRESEERLRFLDNLGQQTAELNDAATIMSTTARMLGEHLGVSNCAYADMDGTGDGFTIRGDWSSDGHSSIVGHYSLADFGELALRTLNAGEALVIHDNQVEIAPEEAATFQSIGIRATICVPLIKRGRLAALMAIHDQAPRKWSEREESLLRAVTERSWAHIERVAALANLAELNRDLEALVAKRTAELIETEETLRQSLKMEAVGQLTGGLAHDFNNILAGIGGSLELMSRRLAQGRYGEIQRYITGATGAVSRAAGLTQRLLAFSRRQTLSPRPQSVESLITDMTALITTSIGPAIALETWFEEDLWPTYVDASQLENALLNLCLNARDAMPDGGTIRIEASNAKFGTTEAQARRIPAGDYVCIAVSDNGTGMSEDVITRAFDPFFTTKPTGSGTGLGLSMVYGFAGQSGGTVTISSELAQGTTVRLYLPRHHGLLDPAVAMGGSTVPSTEHQLVILVVDDEPLVRGFIAEQLQDAGHRVVEAADGPAAMVVLNSMPEIDVLITDVGLPNGMNGRQLVDAALGARPELRILFVTGYAEQAVLKPEDLPPGAQVLTKPFKARELATRLEVLVQRR